MAASRSPSKKSASKSPKSTSKASSKASLKKASQISSSFASTTNGTMTASGRVLQAYLTPTHHLPHLQNLTLALVSLHQVKTLYEACSESLEAKDAAVVSSKIADIVAKLQQFLPQQSYEDARATWDDVLTRRQRDIHQVASGSTVTLGSSFMGQCAEEVSQTVGGEFDDKRMYKVMLQQLTSEGDIKASKAVRGAGGSKKVNDVDRKASKGRKIRYKVHEKLVNFAVPATDIRPAIDEDMWFKSLFR